MTVLILLAKHVNSKFSDFTGSVGNMYGLELPNGAGNESTKHKGKIGLNMYAEMAIWDAS